MKKLQFILVVLGMIFLVSCEDMLDLGIEVESNEVTVDFQILPTDYIGDTTLAVNVMQSDFDNAIAEAGLAPEDVQSIKLKEAVIEITNADSSITFDYFETVEAAIKVDGLEELTIAYMDTIPREVRALECKVNDSELIEYVTAPEYMMMAIGKTVVPIEETIFIKGTLSFSIKTSMDIEMN